MKKKWLWGCLGSLVFLMAIFGVFLLIFGRGIVYLIPKERIIGTFRKEWNLPQPVKTISLNLPSRIAIVGREFEFSGICPPGTPDKTPLHFRFIQYSTGGLARQAGAVINDKFRWSFTFPSAGFYSIQAVLHHSWDDETYPVSPVKFLFVLPRLWGA